MQCRFVIPIKSVPEGNEKIAEKRPFSDVIVCADVEREVLRFGNKMIENHSFVRDLWIASWPRSDKKDNTTDTASEVAKKIDRLIAPGLDILVHLHKTLMVPARLGTAPGPDGRSDVELCYAKIIVPGMILENVLRINYIIRGRGRRHWAIFGGPTVQGHCVSEECHRAPISEEDDDKFVLCCSIDDSDV